MRMIGWPLKYYYLNYKIFLWYFFSYGSFMWYSFDIHCTIAKSNCMVRDVQKTLKSQWITKMQTLTIYLHWNLSVVFLASKSNECCFIWSWNVTKDLFYAKISIEIDHFDEQNCLKIVKIIFFFAYHKN